MTVRRVSAVFLLLCLAATGHVRAEEAPPKLDPKRIINESYSFLKNQEPEMQADEYALYEKAVSLIAVRPEFGLKLLESMVSSGEHKSPAFELALGNVYYTNGRPELAEKYFRQAIEHYPDFQRAWNNLAALLYSQNRYAEAIPSFTKVVAGGKGDAGTLGILAYCQARTGNTVAAEMNYLQALGLDPTNPDWLSGLLSLSLDAKQYGRAEALLKQLVRVKPQDPHNWVVYASVLNSEGRPLEAIAMLDAARSLGYASEEALLLLADMCSEQKLPAEAIDAFQAVLPHSPDVGAKRLIAYAEALTATGQLREAETAFAKVLASQNSETTFALLRARARFHIEKRDLAAAQSDLDAALKLQPLDGQVLLSLGEVYVAQDKFAAADLVLEQAARIPAASYHACLQLGEIALKTHRYPRALEYFEKAERIEHSTALQQYIAKLKLAAPTPDATPSKTL
jgi:tetratricopeptide (TPR) repeat protein